MDACPKCGGFMRMTEKDTSSGRDIREYKCSDCGYSDWEDRGTALWKVLSDTREEAEASCAANATTSPASRTPASRWKRLLTFLGLREK